nr:M17 family peptidase N-terminal domain-containing protein [Ktedonobacteraceae bacterium]
MNIQATSRAIKDVACDAVAIGVVRARGNQGNTSITLSGAARAVDNVLDGLISQLGSDGEFKGNLGEMTTIHTMGKLAARRVVIVGLGSQ